MVRFTMVVWFSVLSFQGYTQKYSVETYIDEFKYIAIEEMEEAGIPASITLAQGILESRYGNSELTLASNNHFGIKCHDGWTGKRYFHDDDRKNECFRVYKNPEQSFHDHTEFLTTRSRYDFLFSYSSTDYKKWAHGLRKAGYATNPKYGTLLVDLIERHQLYLYDRPGNGAIAHNNRHDHQEVQTNGNYKMNDNTVHTQSSVKEGGQEAVFSHNRIRTIAAGKYDNIRLIADRNFIPVKRLMKYNDLQPGQALVEGQLIYLQPKRGKAEQKIHMVRADESLWEISQKHGVKLYKLRQRNLLASHEEPAPGETIYLNKKAHRKPVVKKYDPAIYQNPNQVQFETADLESEVEEIIVRKEQPANRTGVSESSTVPVVRSDSKKKEVEPEAAKKDIDPLETTAVAIKEPDVEKTMPADAQNEEISEEIYVNEDALIEKSQRPVEIAEKSSDGKLHTVKKGDTLYSVSKLYSVSVADLKAWNKLESNLISIAQKLIVTP